ncbi:unnamed protein product [Linum trigynum]|uniref:Uncharacterized protein n=1 Tax=Linum trigynum TaxID=586398 RepID=A0AAV2FS04_9ROSI
MVAVPEGKRCRSNKKEEDVHDASYEEKKVVHVGVFLSPNSLILLCGFMDLIRGFEIRFEESWVRFGGSGVMRRWDLEFCAIGIWDSMRLGS